MPASQRPVLPIDTSGASSSSFHRPKSTGSMSSVLAQSTPYARPMIPAAVPAPYMVALSGWPEPIYIANPRSRSRPSTPHPFDTGEVHDGIPAHKSHPASPTSGPSIANGRIPPNESIFSKPCVYSNPDQECTVPDHPHHLPHNKYSSPLHARNHLKAHSGSQLAESSFPTSSARGTPHPSPPSSVRSSPVMTHFDPRRSTFKDPRLGPRAAVLDRKALPVAPNWSSSTTPHGSSGVGVKVQAGQRGTGILVMRSVPDVYPPPAASPGGMVGMATGMARTASGGGRGVGLATEVYPRDPDTPFLWGSAAGVPSRGASADASGYGEDENKMDFDEIQ